MSLPFFPRKNRARKAKAAPARPKSHLRLEALEERSLMNCTTISGFVSQGANANGLFDSGQSVFANTAIELRNANNIVVGTTTTDGQGHYAFTSDQTISQAPATLTKTVQFAPTQTDFSLQGMLDQFDPELGELKSIEITHA